MIHGDASRLCQGPEFGNSSQVCTSMFCLDPYSSGTCFQHEAARGTSCGNKRWCMDGICQYSEDAPEAVEGCVFGDQAGVSFDGQTCEEFTSGENSAYCYQEVVRGRCCASCQKYYTGAEECLYGDKVKGCEAKYCASVYRDGTKYSDNCCRTCGTFTTTTPSSTSTVAVTTTARPTTTVTFPTDCTVNHGDVIGVRINGMSCADYVESDRSNCYLDTTQQYCCASCRDQDTGVQGCEYGDKFTNCDSDFCDFVYDDGTTYNSYCCQTCDKSWTTTPSSLPTSTTTTVSTTTTSTSTTTTTTTPTTTTTTSTTTTPTTTTTTTQTTPTTTTPTTTTPTTTTPTTTTPTTTTTTSTTTTTPTTTTTTITTTISQSKCSDTIYGVRCPSYIRVYGRGRCYNSYVSSVCCEVCESVSDKRRPDCQYGDRLDVCNPNLCGIVLANDQSYNYLCCQTCAPTSSTEQPTTTTSTTSTTSQTSTVPKTSTTSTSTSTTSTTTTTAEPCIDTRANCSIIQKFNMVQCYQSDVERQCCATCTAYEDASNTGCKYGDREPERCSKLPRPLAESCPDEADNCCDTCRRFISAAGSFSSSPFAILLTTISVLYLHSGL